jgi:hypothetical protein
MLLDAADNGTLKEIREIIRINPCFQAISRSAVKPDFINNFGIEKIAFLTDIQQFTYIAAFVNNKTAVLKKILTINPDFVTYVADNYSSVNIFDNKFINICKIENIAWFTPEEQRTLCSQYRRYEHYSSFNIELLGNQYRQLKGNVTKTKKLVKDRKKQLSIPEKV